MYCVQWYIHACMFMSPASSTVSCMVTPLLEYVVHSTVSMMPAGWRTLTDKPHVAMTVHSPIILHTHMYAGCKQHLSYCTFMTMYDMPTV